MTTPGPENVYGSSPDGQGYVPPFLRDPQVPMPAPEQPVQYNVDGLPVAPAQPRNFFTAPPPQAYAPVPAPHQMYAAMPQMPVYAVPQKSRAIAALLCFFLGSFGVHDFYSGYHIRGVIKLGVSLSLVLLWFFIPFVWLWCLLDFIMILTRSGWYATDARGIPFD
ncbi:TM2 domain-containing protein [Corynebacterium sp. 13CS0277]|uniref:TM2 domain-containing protein n=1 Tax=Corynebacterium sp. 13CS0277 TaxID=2071994 RepID=UPI001E42BE08|nr:TM2 domain-containing protein [Corynebacterium sp. 13CS0277]